MFYNYSISGNYVFNHEEISNNQMIVEVKRYMNVLGDYADGDYPIALYLSRGPKAIICMLALLELGIPFINIDKSIPDERIQYMLKNIGVRYAIVDQKLEIEEIENIDVLGLSSTSEKKEFKINESQYAYYMFTSGTTGIPKAVPILRESLVNFFDGISNSINFKKEQRILNLTSYSFDIVFLETLYALYTGLTVVLTDDEQVDNIKEIADLLVKDCVDIVQMTPSRLKMFKLVDSNLSCFSNIKFVLIGGEAFQTESLKLLQKCTSARIYNMYGPTETTIWSTISDLTDKENIDIGKAIVNTDIYILDDNNQILYDGKEGEICIAGKGLSTGYVNNDDATSKAFINVIIEGKDTRLYKTGDMGKIDKNGIVYCFGRKDNQIKYNGHRIELDDIDSNINSLHIVDQVVTCFDKEKNSFITYYIADTQVDGGTFIKLLSNKIPDYMIPRKYIKVKNFFFTVSGKLDRNKMLEISDNICNIEENDDSFFTTFARVFNKHGISQFSEQTEIVEIVSDSIVFMEILVNLEEEFGIEFDVDKLSMKEYETVADLIKVVKQKV